MLTGKNTKPQQAVNYFMDRHSHEVKNSRWFGKGAEKLGLTGAINDKEVFTNIVNGRSPDGSQALYAKTSKSCERRAATDFTFSAPKSVSLQALVGGDERLIHAHSLAVQKTLLLIESRYSYTRITTNTGRELTKTGNLVIAEFDHIESRELDPHLHTHTLLMNMTQLNDEDGKWHSLSNNEIFKNKKFLGMVYQHHLATEVQRLGYQVEHKKHGQFELKGLGEEDLQEFSKRRQQILQVVGENSTWAEREGAWSITRAAKQKIAPDELKAKWREEAEAFGIQFIKWQAPQPDFEPRSITQKHLEAAIAHCSERNVSFTQEDLEKFILEQGLATDVSQIEPLIQANAELLTLSEQRRDFTTLSAVNREIATIKLMQSGQGKFNPLVHPEVAESYLESTALNRDQRRAVLDTVTTTDQFTAWQGVAGAGKTFALKELKAIATTCGYTIKGFAPSSMAAKVLGEELDIQAETVARLLVSEPSPEIEPNLIWVVDEAGLLSAKDALALLERAKLEQAIVLLVGDTKQLSAVEAGNPFKSLQQAGIKTSYLNESNRQRAPKLKLAVDLIASGSIEEGFKRLDENGYIETVTPESKIEAIANEYITATPEQRAKTLVLAGTNRERLAITQAIREHLLAEGSLGTTAKITQLQAKDLTQVQKRYTHNFEQGDMVMPTRNYKRRGLSKGKLYQVVGKDNDSLTLKDSDGKHFQVDTKFDKAVFQSVEIEVAEGDRLRWTKNDRQLGRRNGQEFVVKAITGNQAQIQYLDHGQTEFIDLKQAQHLDYALVSTTYSSQGKTADRVLIAADHTVGQESFYVAVSRARYELKLYTEDKEDLFSLAQSSKAKENALFLLRQQQLEKQQAQQFQKEAVTEKASQQTTATSSPIKISVEQPVKTEPQPNFIPPILRKSPLKTLPQIAFWTPDRSNEPPETLDPKHWRELVEGSAIHPAIAALNFKSLHQGFEWEHEAWEHLMYSQQLPRTNTGRLSTGFLNKYAHIEDGGWWCDAGVNPKSFANLQPGHQPDRTLWGCYKPHNPREKLDKPGKFIKYEHPPKTDLSIFLLDVPDDLADRIYKKYGVEPSQSDRTSGFWYCVWKHNLPVTITEGAKKAASLLSQGHPAIGLPGIYAGYRSKDDQGEKVKARLMDELAVFATPEREITFCFDYENRPETKLNIEIAISRTGRLLEKQAACVSVVTLPGPDKGVDDLIVSLGPLAYELLNYEAISLRDWQQRNQQQRKPPYQPPRKLTLQERRQRLAASSDSESLQNHIQEQNHDLKQSQHSATIRNLIINSEDGSTIEPPSATEHQNRTVRISQPGIEAGDSQRQTRTSPKFERVLGAISRHLELEEVEQLEGHFRELNRSLTSNEFRGQRTAHHPDDTQQLYTASFNNPKTYVSLKASGLAINAISEFLDNAAIESAIDIGRLQTLIRDLQPPKPIVQISQATQDKALTAITQYLDLAAVESHRLVQKFEEVIEQLKQLPMPTPLKKTALAPPSTPHALKAIADFVEQETLSSALAKALPSVIEAVKQEQMQTIKTISEDSQSTEFEAFKQSIDSLTNQELLYLEQAVREYFSQPAAQKPLFIDRPAIEHQINQLQQQIASLWVEHAQQEKVIKLLELLPLHQLTNKYNLAVNQQLQTINTIQDLFTQKQQLELSLKQWETQTQNYQAWEREQQTINMKIILDVLKFPPLQERLSIIKNELLRQEQHKQSQAAIQYHNNQQPRQSRGLRL
ncbi:MobF family relaxase [Nostoc sp. FACHB-110]|uniref:MobF family relaxase n=1 Tax=Nostoc sp. FACHB-110 TaxID=2692834 RepID=UPI0016850CA3|nr:MobF family relaxase [Nostoc sp. FACHB-110]MBD2438857.1 relaxase domain-containing protein [Nostoc sp. FACHB-110]